MEVGLRQGLRKGPLLALMVVGFCLIVYAHSGLADFLVYNRRAVLTGQLWRLLTGHLVHFSFSHLFFNMIGFSLAVWIAWQRRYGNLALLTVLSACLIGVAILLIQTEMTVYGGMSGIINAVAVYAACLGLWAWGSRRILSLGLLALCAGTVVGEAALGQPVLVAPGAISFVPVPLAHIVGGMTGAGLALWEKIICPLPLDT